MELQQHTSVVSAHTLMLPSFRYKDIEWISKITSTVASTVETCSCLLGEEPMLRGKAPNLHVEDSSFNFWHLQIVPEVTIWNPRELLLVTVGITEIAEAGSGIPRGKHCFSESCVKWPLSLAFQAICGYKSKDTSALLSPLKIVLKVRGSGHIAQVFRHLNSLLPFLTSGNTTGTMGLIL